MKYKVHPAAEIFPLLEGDAFEELVEDIRSNGLIDPVWLYDDPELGTVLLDGRNRLAACEAAGVEIRTRKYTGDDPVGFSVSQNVKRRHLTDGQLAAIAYATIDLYEAEAEKRKRELSGTRSNPDEVRAHGPVPAKTKPAPRARDKAAKAVGTSGRSVGRYKRVAQNAPDLAEKVQSGTLALRRAERIIRDRNAEQKRVEQARKDAELEGKETIVDIRHGDFREVLTDIRDVDAVITDPPYPHEYLPLLEDLAKWSDQVLNEDGLLAVLIGKMYLPEVFQLLDGYRPYRWTICYHVPGPGNVVHPRGVQTNWKPLLIYGNYKKGGIRFSDVVTSEGSDADAKNNHKWGQDYNAFHTIIERLTHKGQTVVDPFMGSGTTLLAAHALGRNAIGCDVEEESVQKAKERLL